MVFVLPQIAKTGAAAAIHRLLTSRINYATTLRPHLLHRMSRWNPHIRASLRVTPSYSHTHSNSVDYPVEPLPPNRLLIPRQLRSNFLASELVYATTTADLHATA